jgi:hypothetical protein
MTQLTTLVALPGMLVLAIGFVVAGGDTMPSTVLEQKEPITTPTRFFFGKSACTGKCHDLIEPLVDKDLPAICRCTEFTEWDSNDKHKLAHKVLNDQRGQRMAELLGFDVAKDKRCVSCHGVWIEPNEMDKYVDTKYKDFNVRMEEGVTCGACHGHYKEWVKEHAVRFEEDRKKWRALARMIKQTHYGMKDLWNPINRTRLCASCHIGNAADGKIVTHEMYAAGHPPLPAFEIVTFSNQMPRHWQYLKEKDEAVLKLLKFNHRDAELEETHLLAIGGLVAFEANLKLLEAQAATKDWPELAHFDCYACHHELKSKSWRQERGFAGKPGRPPLREWPTALVELGLWHAAGTDTEAAKLLAKFQDQLAALQAVFDAQPFGQGDKVIPQVKALREWMDLQVKEIQKRIQDSGYRAEASAKLLGHLLDMQRPHFQGQGKQPVPDFDSARQLAWAYQVLYLETVSKHDPKARQKQATAMTAQAAWKGLNDYLLLTLPQGQKKLEGSLATNLNHSSNYEPREFFKYLGAALKEFSPK